MKLINKFKNPKIAAILTVFIILSSVFVFSAFAENSEGSASDSDISTEVQSDSKDQLQDNKTDSENSDSASDDSDDSSEKNESDNADSEKTATIRDGGNFLAVWFGKALKILSDFSGSYVIGILLLALIIKIILFPLSIKQQKNSQKMAKLAPKQEAIRKKYAGRNDRATQMKMNEEIQQLYAEEKFNPMSGCLPLLLQLPVIWALYTAITSPLSSMLGFTKETLAELAQNLTIHSPDIAGKTITQADAISRIASAGFNPDISKFYDELKLFSVNLMDNPSFSSLLIIVPILVFLSSFFSTKLIRKFTYNPNGAAQETSMKIMDWTMPLMILWFSFSVPSLVGIYWVFQNIISIAQQFALYKLFPVKAPTPEEIREAELLMKGKKIKNVVYEDNDEPSSPQPAKKPPVSKASIKKKKANSPFIYAKKGISPKYLDHIKEKGSAPKAKKKP